MSKKLPVVGTSAASTAFCAAKVIGPLGEENEDWLWIDGNGKITWQNGTLADPKPNAFSLVQIEDCPGSTESCRASCYVHGLEKHAPDTHELYKWNSREIREILDVGAVYAREWAECLAAWIRENAPGGFRWHVSGDVFSAEYARWISAVCELSPGVQHWIYTRSFEHVGDLDAPNLTVNLSADRDNWQAALECARDWPGTRICFMATADGWIPEGLLAHGDVIFPDYALRDGTEQGRSWFNALPPEHKQMTCPVDRVGKSEERRCGPCPRCLHPSEVTR